MVIHVVTIPSSFTRSGLVTGFLRRITQWVSLVPLICFISGLYFIYVIYIMYIGVQYDFHIKWCSCCSTVIMKGTTSGAGTAYLFEAHEKTPVFFVWLVNLQCSVLWIIVCLFVLILLSFDLQLLITPLVSSKFS